MTQPLLPEQGHHFPEDAYRCATRGRLCDEQSDVTMKQFWLQPLAPFERVERGARIQRNVPIGRCECAWIETETRETSIDARAMRRCRNAHASVPRVEPRNEKSSDLANELVVRVEELHEVPRVLRAYHYV